MRTIRCGMNVYAFLHTNFHFDEDGLMVNPRGDKFKVVVDVKMNTDNYVITS
jgi:hypothetical protein